MRNFLLTGSTGFVGKNLVSFFQGKDIGTVVSLNLRNKLPSKLPPGDAIIHLAGKAHDVKGTSNDDEYFEVNYRKTKDLFDRFLESDTKDFFYFSSVKAAADTVTDVLTEDILPNPKTPYGQSKLEAEVYLLSQKLPAGKRLFILRPCMIHGQGNKGNLNLLYKVVKKGIPYPLGAFENKRSFLSITNLCFVIEQLLKDRTIAGGIYHLADDEPLSTNEVIRIIGEASDTKTRIWHMSPNIINTLAKMGDMLHLPLNSERLKKLTESYVVSNEKIKQVLDIQVLPVSSRKGLVSTIKSFR